MLISPRSPPIQTVPPVYDGSQSVDLARFRADLRDADIEDMLGALLDTFLEDCPARLAALEKAVESGDTTAIETTAHAFKSGASTVRAMRLADLLRKCEHAARTDSAFSATGLIELVRSECAAVRVELEARATQ